MKRTRKNKNKIFFGGEIFPHNILKYIKSIGFELETINLSKLTLEPRPEMENYDIETDNEDNDNYEENEDEENNYETQDAGNGDGNKVLVNSALSNIDLENGYEDEYEYTYIINEPDIQFKITNDSNDDSLSNDYINEKIQQHKDNLEDEDELENKDTKNIIEIDSSSKRIFKTE